MAQDQTLAEMHAQTGQLSWAELARFFAAGKLLQVDQSLDLVDVAAAFSDDEAARVAEWLEQALIVPIGDRQASDWQQCEQRLWAVVAAPWVLVQVPS